MWFAYFLLTLFNSQFANGMAGAYSVVKADLKKELGIDESFFGVMQMFAMFTRMAISLKLILLPSKTPKRTYTFYVVVTSVSCGLIMLSKEVPDAAKVLLFIGVVGLAPIRACSPLCYLMAYQYLSGPQFVTALNMWLGLNKFGNIWAYLLKYLLENILSLSYIIFLGIFLALFFFVGMLTFFIVKEIDMPEEQDLPCAEKASLALNTLKTFYTKQLSNFLLLCDYSFQENTMIYLKFWLPLYLIEIGLKKEYLFIMMTFPVAVTLGSFMNFLIARWPEQKPIFTSVLLFLSFIAFSSMYFLKSDESQAIYYYFSVGFGFFFTSAPFSRAATSQVAVRVESMRENYLVVNSLKLIREILSAIYMLLIGLTMKTNPRSFLYFVVLNGFLAFFFHVWRRIAEAREERENAEKNEEAIQSDSEF